MEFKIITEQEAKELGIDVDNLQNEVELSDIVDENGKEVLPSDGDE